MLPRSGPTSTATLVRTAEQLRDVAESLPDAEIRFRALVDAARLVAALRSAMRVGPRAQRCAYARAAERVHALEAAVLAIEPGRGRMRMLGVTRMLARALTQAASSAPYGGHGSVAEPASVWHTGGRIGGPACRPGGVPPRN